MLRSVDLIRLFCLFISIDCRDGIKIEKKGNKVHLFFVTMAISSAVKIVPNSHFAHESN